MPERRAGGHGDGGAAAHDGAAERLLDAVAEAAPDVDAVIREGLARAVARRMPADERTPEAVAALVVRGAAILQRRRPGELTVEVGRDEHGTTVDTVVDDVPFLLSTVASTLQRRRYDVDLLLHPVLGVEREADGVLADVAPARADLPRESWIHAKLPLRLSDAAGEALRVELVDGLDSACRVEADLAEMRTRLVELSASYRELLTDGYRESPWELARLVDWLLADRLIMLAVGDVRPDGTPVEGSGHGLLARGPVETLIAPRRRDALLRVGRSARPSVVHRAERMVELRFATSPEGVERRVIGLFSPEALAESVEDVPVARRHFEQILAAEDLVEGSHDARLLTELFSSLPLHEQLAAEPEGVRAALVPLLAEEERVATAVRYLAADPEREVVVLVHLAKERFDPVVRERMQEHLRRRLAAHDVDYHLSMTSGEAVLLHFIAHPPPGGRLASPRIDVLRSELVGLARTWDDRIGAALAQTHGRAQGADLAREWLPRLGPGYRDLVGPAEAVADLRELSGLVDAGEARRMRLLPAADGGLRAKLYVRGGGVELSQLVPVLESLGLVVVDERPHAVDGVGTIHDVLLRLGAGMPPAAELASRGGDAAATALAVLAGEAEGDDLNRLVLLTDLDWRDVALLRALRRFRRQLGTGFTESYQNAALAEHAPVAEALVELFDARFDPARSDADVAASREAVEERLAAVTRLDQDRILRGYLGIVEATLRTNRYADPPPAALALKLDSALVPEVGKPVPHVEAFVYAPAFEGVHLRGGPVARGGLRHSDRREDVRAEVLGLMKAQMTKNALIVPVGAKGGFVLKGAGTPGPDEVRAAYESFIGALLDLTDDVEGGEVVTPPGVRPADGPDPYLVVAPDRGTGRFSDAANLIAGRRGFWLGDAFASGGSRGFDHKGMGITARGAWVAVRRHFAELGIDVDTEPVSVVGIGDMSGDVFGNALLQSRALRLVAAFDHRDVFLDPDPDPERAYAERERLAGLPGSSWQDYDGEALSAGGGVFSRESKAIPLSEEVRALLRVDAEELSPPEVIRAVLAAQVDLLFAGGIGTYVKAAEETHAEVADRANDGVRVDAGRLSARVVGEGANLALTQRARIAYSRRGGRCNTDAIDNAAGVATSDLEVNLKILLVAAIAEERLAEDDRDAVLLGAEDEVAARVLDDCDRQTRALSRELARSPGGLEGYEDLMADLEEGGRLDREVEGLPSSAELARRGGAGAGLTRPELAQLLAYAKLDLRDAVLASDLPVDPETDGLLFAYFPPFVAERYGDLARGHRLRRELVATRLAGAVVDDMGITWARRLTDELAVDLADAAAAYRVARTVVDAGRRWDAIAGLGSEVDAAAALELDAEVRSVVDACARAYLRQGLGPLGEAIAADRPAADEVAATHGDVDVRRRAGLVRRWVDAGVPKSLAEDVAALHALEILPDVAALSRRRNAAPEAIASAFAAASSALPVDRLDALLDATSVSGRWSRWQREGLAEELRRARRGAVASALREADGEDPVTAMQAWLDRNTTGLERVDGLLAGLGEAEDELVGLAVAVRALRDVTG